MINKRYSNYYRCCLRVAARLGNGLANDLAEMYERLGHLSQEELGYRYNEIVYLIRQYIYPNSLLSQKAFPDRRNRWINNTAQLFLDNWDEITIDALKLLDRIPDPEGTLDILNEDWEDCDD